jgi:hypothetical protein
MERKRKEKRAVSAMTAMSALLLPSASLARERGVGGCDEEEGERRDLGTAPPPATIPPPRPPPLWL